MVHDGSIEVYARGRRIAAMTDGQRNYLDAISGVFGHAIDHGHELVNPVDGLRAIEALRDRVRTEFTGAIF